MSATPQKWMPWDSADCCSNLAQELSKDKAAGEGKLSKNEGGVEEIEILLERSEEKKKHLKKKRMSYGDGGITVEDQRMNIISGLKQETQGLPDVIEMLAHNKSSTSPWKPCFEWEDLNINNSLCGESDLNRKDGVNKEDDVDVSIEIELQVFPI